MKMSLKFTPITGILVLLTPLADDVPLALLDVISKNTY